MNEKLQSILNELHNNSAVMYYVGGYVRDGILGIENNDIDIEIYNLTADEIETILLKFDDVDTFGKSFGVIKSKGIDVDFTLPRCDSKSGDKHTDFEIVSDPFMTTKEAARRRDFTINSIMKNVMTGEIVDNYNGVNDLKTGVIRMVDGEKFADDILRPLRAARFASRFGFAIDPELIELCNNLNYSELPVERITSEVEKILLSGKPSIGFNAMLELGIVEKLFPELFDLVGTLQNPTWHPEGDAWVHTMNVIDGAAVHKHNMKNPLAFMYACLLHDIGKPATTALNKRGEWSSLNHEYVGAKMVSSVMKRFTKMKSMNSYVYSMVLNHMIGHRLTGMRKVKIRRAVAKMNMHDLLYLNACDNYWAFTSAEEYLTHENHIAAMTAVLEVCDGKLTIEPVITSADLIACGYEPGEEFGRILREAYSMQVDGVKMETIRKKLAEHTLVKKS